MTNKEINVYFDPVKALMLIKTENHEELHKLHKKWQDQINNKKNSLLNELQQKAQDDGFFKGFSIQMTMDLHKNIYQFIAENINLYQGVDWMYVKWRKKFISNIVIK